MATLQSNQGLGQQADDTEAILQSILPDHMPRRVDEFRAEKPHKCSQDDLLREQVAEQKQRRRLRWVMLVIFVIVLAVQHWAVIALIYDNRDKIQELQPMLAIIVPATLGETYAIIKIMVQFIFSPGNFENNNAFIKK